LLDEIVFFSPLAAARHPHHISPRLFILRSPSSISLSLARITYNNAIKFFSQIFQNHEIVYTFFLARLPACLPACSRAHL
jgi:hypothetical protein